MATNPRARTRDLKAQPKSLEPIAFTLFPTALGTCALAWTERGLCGFQLPEASAASTQSRLLERFPNAQAGSPPKGVAATIARVARLFEGEKVDLSKVPLDLAAAPEFHRRVYALVQSIPHGTTLSYGEVARRLGSPGAARAVGQAMGKNPVAVLVPCHRVTAQSGKLGGFSAYGGVVTKQRMLALEGYPDVPASSATPATGRTQPPRAPSTSADRAKPARSEEPQGAAPKLPFDPAKAWDHLTTSDPKLARLMRAVGPFRMALKPSKDLFESVAESIVYQQLSAKAAGTIYGRVRALVSPAGGALDPARLLKLDSVALRGAGLSGAKLLALQDLARHALAGTLPTLAQARKLEDEELVSRLSAVRGVGRWTAEMILIFTLGRPDVLPVGDASIRKAFELLVKPKQPSSVEQLVDHAARWSPYRTVASWYLWQSLDLPKLP